MVGVILAAGDGKRLKESRQEDCCKPLIKIKGKRLIEYALDNLVELEADKAYIVVGKEGNLIKKILGDQYNGLELFYVVQPEQLGLINAFTYAINIIGCSETVVLQLSDEIFVGLEIEKIKNCIKDGAYDFYCGVTFEEDPEKIKKNFSVDVYDEGIIRKCVEKPTNIVNNIKGTGFCVFNSEALKLLNNKKDKEVELLHDLCDYINYMIVKGNKGLAFCIARKEFNINTFADLFEVQSFLYVD